MLEQAIRDQIRRRTGGRVQPLEVQVTEGRVTIHGRTGCYYLKQLALQGVLDVIGTAPSTLIDLRVQVLDRDGQSRIDPSP
jgi:hypothetical protein